MKIGKKVKNRVGSTISKVKQDVWRLIIVAIFLLGLILIGRPLISAIGTTIEIHKLNKEKALYEASILRDSTTIENLKDDLFLERYAREKYQMRAKDEQVFIVE
jgi:cell division protein FtsB